MAARPSYESFLRIKQGVGNDALRAAGLPSAENLSYDAYVAALNRKAAALRAAEKAPPTPAASGPKGQGVKRVAWGSLVIVPMALACILLIADILKDRPDGTSMPSASEALAAPLTGDGLPIALAVTTMEAGSSSTVHDDEATAETGMPFDHEVAAASPPSEKVELLAGPAPAAAVSQAQSPATKKKTAAAPREPAKATAVPPQERRVASAKPEKKAAEGTRQPAKKQGDFWQPLRDMLDGKGVRGARNVPPPEDRIGR